MCIHEREDWPHFRWDERALATKLAYVRHRQGRFIGRMEALGFRFREEVVLQTLTDDVIKSSEIAGDVLDKDQVRSSIARRPSLYIGSFTPADRDVEGVVEMMLDATQGYKWRLTVERLFGWHAALFPTGRSWIDKITVGAWRDDRDGAMPVVSGLIGRERVHYEAPKASRIDSEVNVFVT